VQEQNQQGGDIDVSLVLPAYMVTSDLESYVTDLVQMFRDLKLSFEIIIVDDGNQPPLDKEIATLSGAFILRHDQNRGKGAALKTGFHAAQGEFIGFVDADGEITTESVRRCVVAITEEHWDAVIGSKYLEDSVINTSEVRALGSKVIRRLVKHLLKVKVSDTQTGLKFFSRGALIEVLDYTTSEGYALDIELIKLLEWHGAKIKEVPVQLNKSQQSSLNTRRVLIFLMDFLKIYRKADIRVD